MHDTIEFHWEMNLQSINTLIFVRWLLKLKEYCLSFQHGTWELTKLFSKWRFNDIHFVYKYDS